MASGLLEIIANKEAGRLSLIRDCFPVKYAGAEVLLTALYQHPKLKKLVAEMVIISAPHTLPDCKFYPPISDLI
jgi:hypothetical protein